jgi:membrane-bound lytic murein transglycosylase B
MEFMKIGCKIIGILLALVVGTSTLLPVFSIVHAQVITNEAQRAKLEAELAALQKEIAQWEQTLTQQRQQSGTLVGDISILTSKINKAKADVKAKNLTIQKLTQEINKKSQTIENLSEKIEREKDSLGQLIRKTNEKSDIPIAYVILGNDTLSSLYTDLDSYATLKKELNESVNLIQGTRQTVETEKKSLEKKQDEETDTKVALEKQKAAIEQSEREKQKLLSISKDKEKTYQQVLSERQSKAAQIRAALFNLRDSAAIPFGDALKYAEFASQKTGVRPAFVLAILTQESALGKNVGSCYLGDPLTGAGVGANTGTIIQRVMSPSRDVVPFLEITKSLGRDPYKTRVSCPQQIGWGGAMGPAQFIPSTWNIMKASVAVALGKKAADPWNPQDAFMASAMYLKNLGANGQTYTTERTAACKYYSGRTCYGATGAPNVGLSYGNQVMAKADTIQKTMIDPLEGL